MQNNQSLTSLVEFRANDAVCTMNGFFGNPRGTRLTHAVHTGDWGEVTKCIEEGCDVDKQDGEGVPPIIYTIGHRYEIIYGRLQKRAAN